jgi:2-oxoglutarate dehydrogenase E1 component
MDSLQQFGVFNAAYVDELYERYRINPESVDSQTRAVFDRWSAADPWLTDRASVDASVPACGQIVRAVSYIESIRKFGYMDAHIDPLGGSPPGDPSLAPETHGITEAELRRLPADIAVGSIAEGKANALEVVKALRRIYCSAIGYDYAHLRGPEEREWLRQAAESGRFRPPADPINPHALLERLTEVEVFSRFLLRTFPGKSFFSGEGLDMLIPVLDEVIGEAAESGVCNILIGMAHRARASVLAHVLKKPYTQILAEFRDPMRGHNFREGLGWTGDVRYHAGARRALSDGAQIDLVIAIPPNPSHLEAIDPVVEGMARAAGTSATHPGPPRFDPSRTLPVLIHGDASFMGQGVVAETLNFERLPGYTTGGTIHIITNNQLGFTATPEEVRSTYYASDLARGFKIPIAHVNADDPESCIEVARLAFAYRARFHRDFLIDLVGYRRYGHNEADEPRFTQPLMYQAIDSHATVREIWARTLLERGTVGAEVSDLLVHKHMAALQSAWAELGSDELPEEPTPPHPPAGAAHKVRTSVSMDRLRELNLALLRRPGNFSGSIKLARAQDRRRVALDDPEARTIHWATAEELALASILEDGIAIRLTGQDACRGTFSQRHAVFYDRETGAAFIPLQALPQARAAFEIHNSPLTENAALGFEYGYSLQKPERLVLWEAQYGDFINGAQTMIDEFLFSARAKWGLTPSLVLLLPHGFEGQGPDHSSARLERFLQLASGANVRIANCTTAAQYFHLLRRQASLIEVDPLPLTVLTPKSLLRHPRCASSPRELAEGRWQPVIDDEQARGNPEAVRRLILCSGKVYIDLISNTEGRKNPAIAICRVEQLYPFPHEEVRTAMEAYPAMSELVWVQEEPENMGAWEFLRPQLLRLLDGRRPLHYIGRDRSSSPAEGSSARHANNQRIIVQRAFNRDLVIGQEDMVRVEVL